MRYFKAIEIPSKPFIQWDCYANSDEEYKALKLNQDRTVVQELNIPENVNGVCPWKIVGGDLVARDGTEMLPYEDEHINDIKNADFSSKVIEINKQAFEFLGHQFHMHESARLLYDTIAANKLDKVEIKTKDSSFVLQAQDVDRFMVAYRTSLADVLTKK